MAERAEAFLARNLAWIRRTPELPAGAPAELDFIDEMFVETALARLDQIEHFSLDEVDFFERGELVEIEVVEDPPVS